MSEGALIEIGGLPGKYCQIASPYVYADPMKRCTCPNCGGLGMPWGGWFSCEDCSCVALVKDGRAFVKTDAK